MNRTELSAQLAAQLTFDFGSSCRPPGTPSSPFAAPCAIGRWTAEMQLAVITQRRISLPLSPGPIEIRRSRDSGSAVPPGDLRRPVLA